MKIVEAVWAEHSVVFARECEEFTDEYYIVKIVFKTSSKGGDRYTVTRKGRELDNLLRELTGAAFQGNVRKNLLACRNKPVWLVTISEGNSTCVKDIMPREC